MTIDDMIMYLNIAKRAHGGKTPIVHVNVDDEYGTTLSMPILKLDQGNNDWTAAPTLAEGSIEPVVAILITGR